VSRMRPRSPYNETVRRLRRICVWIVPGAIVAGAIWLYTYQVPVLVTYVDRTGHQFHPPQRSTEQPWWSAPATFLLVVIGTALIMGLVPERRHLLRRFGESFGWTLPARRASGPRGR
jgi:hypothetical protein